jgi:hypothetical protein
LDWRNRSTHADFNGLVQHTEAANHFVAASPSIPKWGEGSKKKGNAKHETRNPKQARMINHLNGQNGRSGGFAGAWLRGACPQIGD